VELPLLRSGKLDLLFQVVHLLMGLLQLVYIVAAKLEDRLAALVRQELLGVGVEIESQGQRPDMQEDSHSALDMRSGLKDFPPEPEKLAWSLLVRQYIVVVSAWVVRIVEVEAGQEDMNSLRLG